MAPKAAKAAAPVVDTRTPLEIEYDNLTEQLNQLEVQLQRCKEGTAELTTLTAKLRTLEQDLAPRDAELKSVNHSFQKVAESAAGLRRGGGGSKPGGNAASNNAAPADDTPAQPAVPGSILLVGGQVAPAAVVDENADREAIRAFSSAAKAAVLGILQSVYDTPLTPAELRGDNNSSPPESPTLDGDRRGSRGDALLPQRFDVDLSCPIGVEPSVFSDVLRLRTQRIQVDKVVQELSRQVNEVKALVAKRKEEGATKVMQKRLEKQIEDVRKRQLEVEKEKMNEELLKKGGVGAVPAPTATAAADGKARPPSKK